MYRPQANQVERIHRDLRILLPELQVAMKGTISHLDWSGLLPIAANIINTVPHSTTTYPPYYLHHGYLSNDIFEEKSLSDLRKLWADARSKMIKSQEKTLKESGAPIPTVNFEKGDSIFVYLGNQTAKRATVLKDFGQTCLIDKGSEEPARYRVVVVHKSKISRDIFPVKNFEF